MNAWSGFEIYQAEESLLDQLLQPSACYMQERWLWHHFPLATHFRGGKKGRGCTESLATLEKAGEFWCPPVFSVTSCLWPVTLHTAPTNLAVLWAWCLTSRNSGQGAQHFLCG